MSQQTNFRRWGRILILSLLFGPLAARAEGKCRRALETPLTRDEILRKGASLSEIAEKHGVRYLVVRFTREELKSRVDELGEYGLLLQRAELIPVFEKNGQRTVKDLMAEGYIYVDGQYKVRGDDWMIGFVFDVSILDRADVVVSPHLDPAARKARAAMAKDRVNRYSGLSNGKPLASDEEGLNRSTAELEEIFERAGSPSGVPAIGVYFDLMDVLDLRQARALWVPGPIDTFKTKYLLDSLKFPKDLFRIDAYDLIPALTPLPAKR